MIFAPVGALAVWTTVVLFLTGVPRVKAVRARRIPPGREGRRTALLGAKLDVILAELRRARGG